MSGQQIATSVTILSSGLKGYQGVSLTNFTTSALSAIAAGSTVEIANAFFIFSTEESVTGFSVITTATSAFLALTPSGTAGSQIVNAAWTSTAPVWSTSKQGYYASAASVTRVVATGLKTGTTALEWTAMLPKLQGEPALRIMDIGDWDMDATTFVNLTHGLTFGNIRRVSAIVRDDADSIHYSLLSYAAVNATGRVAGITSTDIQLLRDLGGLYDSVNYDSTGYNRGWLYIEYLL